MIKLSYWTLDFINRMFKLETGMILSNKEIMASRVFQSGPNVSQPNLGGMRWYS